MFIIWDQDLFYRINKVWVHPWLDLFFTGLTDFAKSPVFFIFLPFLIFFLHRRFGWKGLAILVLAVMFSAAADILSSEFLKEFFARPRPEFANLPFEVILRRPSEGSFSFPSSHALDGFVLASFIFSFHRPWGRGLFLLAGMIAYSRVYCGLHFPLDVLAGALLGTALGFTLGALLQHWHCRFYEK